MSAVLSNGAETSLPATFTTRDALTAGMHPRELYSLRDDGTILELSRGVFRRADAPAATWPDLLAIQLRSPISVVCSLTAAMVHELTDAIPARIQIAVGSTLTITSSSLAPESGAGVFFDDWQGLLRVAVVGTRSSEG